MKLTEDDFCPISGRRPARGKGMSNLITRSDDERLALGNPETLPSIDDTPQTVDKMHVLRDSLRAALSRAEDAEGQLCRAREALRCWEHWYNVDSSELNRETARYKGIDALGATAPCPHEAEVERLREVQLWIEKEGITLDDIRMLEESEKRLQGTVESLCRETLGAIIDATTIAQVEKLSGNIVKEAYVKGELHSLHLLESWLDRHVPEVMTELRRRADAGMEGT